MDELPSLTNIIHSLSVPKQIQETDIDELRESVYLIIDDFISNNIGEYRYKDFTHRLFEHTYHILEVLHDNTNFLIELNLSELIDEGIYSYFEFYGVKRSETTKITTPKNKRPYSQILKNIKKKDTHEQGTIEWYQFRWNHITASSAWKALEQESTKNQIILDKCKPINTAKYSRVNITSAMHHGHKFEPLSILIYENLYNTKIGEYGCIENDDYPHLAASPDGINIKLDNPRYGRALEIKNPTTREICGIPKKEYWVQMQLQMEVWNLDECDFLETTFDIYENEEEFDKDGTFNLSNDCKQKGIMVQLFDGKEPVYKYAPLNLTKEEFEKWYDNILDENVTLNWICNIYWKINIFSCILVPRNKKWFQSKIETIKEFWNIIEKERITGYEHRKPKKREKKKKIQPSTVIKIDTSLLHKTCLSGDEIPNS